VSTIYPPIYPGEERFREVFNLLERHIERRYEIPVVISDVTDPFTGDLDGQSIAIDYDQPGEDALFIMVHLFGHTVQWNTDARARTIGTARTVSTTPADLADLQDYERTACRYSLQLLREAGVPDLDQWLADFAACDWAYLLHFYQTTEKLPFRQFWRQGMPLLDPLAIPAFQPARWVSRNDGVVI
jgi:hypothetical protein